MDASPYSVSMRNDSALASRWFWSLCHGKSDDRKPNCADPGYCALSGLQTGSITLQMRSKRRKVRGHRAIAPFSDVGRIIDDRYPASVSSSSREKRSFVGLNSLTEVFGPLRLVPGHDKRLTGLFVPMFPKPLLAREPLTRRAGSSTALPATRGRAR